MSLIAPVSTMHKTTGATVVLRITRYLADRAVRCTPVLRYYAALRALLYHIVSPLLRAVYCWLWKPASDVALRLCGFAALRDDFAGRLCSYALRPGL